MRMKNKLSAVNIIWTTKSSERNFVDLGNNTKYLTLFSKAVTNYTYNSRESPTVSQIQKFFCRSCNIVCDSSNRILTYFLIQTS